MSPESAFRDTGQRPPHLDCIGSAALRRFPATGYRLPATGYRLTTDD